MKTVISTLLVLLFISGNAWAETSLVTCPNWRSKNKLYVDHAKKAEILKPEAPKGFVPLYRAMASILGSKRMTPELNEALEKSGYSDLFDVLMAMNYRGGLPDDFVDAIKQFHSSKVIDLDQETYVIDISSQEMLSKFRRSYCK